jgi:hypothetical protein
VSYAVCVALETSLSVNRRALQQSYLRAGKALAFE